MPGNTYQEILEEFQNDGSAQHSVKMEKFLDALSNLVQQTEKYYTKDSKTNSYPVLESWQLNAIRDLYGQAQSAGSELEEELEASPQSRDRMKYFMELLNHDMHALGNLHLTADTTLPDTIANARDINIDMTGKKLETVGGIMSSRIAVTMENGTSGFFTAESNIPLPQEEINRALENIPKDSPYLKYLTEFCNQKMENGEPFLYANQKQRFEYGGNLINDADYELMVKLHGENVAEQLFDDRKFQTQLLSLKKELDSPFQECELYEQKNIPLGRNISNRNVAMSRISQSLGLSDLLAHSRTATMKTGDKTVSGIIMDKAEGFDINSDLGKGNMDLYATKEAWNNTSLKKQLADLQVLDYICSNVDRHIANMFYVPGKNEKGEDIIAGITGIDNDFSFSLMTQKDIGQQTDQLTGADHFGMMRRETA